MAQEVVHFYRLSDVADARAALEIARARSPEYEASFWQPSVIRPFPPGAFDLKLASYTFMRLLGLFASPHYGAVLLHRRDGAVAHRSMIIPRFARFPFMAAHDLQIGATYTRPDARGKGLALRAVLEIVNRYAGSGRHFWYLTDEGNAASVAVIRKAGFELLGTGAKLPRYGLRFFGYYDIGPGDFHPYDMDHQQ